jgi:hypothetical protein
MATAGMPALAVARSRSGTRRMLSTSENSLCSLK